MTLLLSESLTGDTSGSANSALIVRIDPNALSANAGAITLTMSGPGSGTATSIAALWIGHAAASGDVYDFDGTQVQVKVGGNGAFTLPVGTDVVSDTITYAIDKTKALLLAMVHSVGAGTTVRRNTSSTYCDSYYKDGVSDPAEAAVTNKTGYNSLAGWDFILKEINSATVNYDTLSADMADEGVMVAEVALTSAGGTWNPSDKSANIVLSENNFRADLSTSTPGGVRGTVGRDVSLGGKFYMEFYVFTNNVAEDNRVGIATATNALDGSDYPNLPGTLGMGFPGGGGSPHEQGWYGIAYDFDGRTWSYHHTGDPDKWYAIDTILLPVDVMYPFWYGTFDTEWARVNLGAQTFTGSMPGGYTSWDGLQIGSGPDPFKPGFTHWDASRSSTDYTFFNRNLAFEVVNFTGGYSLIPLDDTKNSGKYYVEYLPYSMGSSNNEGLGFKVEGYSGTFGSGGGYITKDGNFYSGGSYRFNIGGDPTGGTIRMALDLDAQLCWFAINGGDWNGSPTADPATGTGGFDYSPYFTAGSLVGPAGVKATPDFKARANFGGWTFLYDAPSGFVGWPTGTGGLAVDFTDDGDAMTATLSPLDVILTAAFTDNGDAMTAVWAGDVTLSAALTDNGDAMTATLSPPEAPPIPVQSVVVVVSI